MTDYIASHRDALSRIHVTIVADPEAAIEIANLIDSLNHSYTDGWLTELASHFNRHVTTNERDTIHAREAIEDALREAINRKHSHRGCYPDAPSS